ncbi:hypothetical protein HK105_206031 [Polyrhizophydium stewartii]|uniref:Uncharacterized protein n=1 Tax=Polyrhizophydium stewartii TaxID=2732419 RepID=A0ABR4N4S6_9FUNG
MFPSALPLATASLQSQFDPVTALSPLVGGDPTTFANPVLRQQLQQLGLSPAGFGGAWAGPQLPITAGAGGIASLGGITSPLGVGSQIGGLAGLGGNVSGFGSPLGIAGMLGSPLTHGILGRAAAAQPFLGHPLVHPAQVAAQFQQQRFLGQMHPLQQQMLQQGGAGWPAVSPLSQYSLVQQQLAQRNAMLGGIGGLGNITGLGGIGGLGIGGYGIGGYGVPSALSGGFGGLGQAGALGAWTV